MIKTYEREIVIEIHTPLSSSGRVLTGTDLIRVMECLIMTLRFADGAVCLPHLTCLLRYTPGPQLLTSACQWEEASPLVLSGARHGAAACIAR